MEKPIKIAWYGKHLGEEPPLVPAGTIFFTGCNLKCVFCQNYEISQENKNWKEYSVKELADIMIDLQKQGAVNIDLVTPTIWFLQIKKAVVLAKKNGLLIPIVWNSNAFENTQLLKRMNGIVDIYLPDFKYGDDELALKYSNAPGYSKIAKKAIIEMLRQVENLKTEKGIAKKGVIVRHLVLPNNTENSFKVLKILSLIDKNIHLSLMSQYAPFYKAGNFPELEKETSEEEFKRVCDFASELGFENGWFQGKESKKVFAPKFSQAEPFFD